MRLLIKIKKPALFGTRFFERQRSSALQGKDFKKIERAPQIRTPEQLLALCSTLKALSSFLDGKLEELNPNIDLFLEDVMQKSPHFVGFNNLTLDTIFNTTSIKRLKRFFKINFIALVEEGYNPKDEKQEELQEERLVRRICDQLRDWQYDQKRVIQEVFPYFDIPIPQEYL